MPPRKARNSVGLKDPILDKGRSAHESTVAAVVASAAAASSRYVTFCSKHRVEVY
jgi:hypothetical protein